MSKRNREKEPEIVANNTTRCRYCGKTGWSVCDECKLWLGLLSWGRKYKRVLEARFPVKLHTGKHIPELSV